MFVIFTKWLVVLMSNEKRKQMLWELLRLNVISVLNTWGALFPSSWLRLFFSLKLFFGGLKMFVLMWVAGFWGRYAFYFDDISVQFKYKNSYFKTVRLWLWWRCFVLLLFGCSEWRVLKSTHMSVYIVGMISMMSWWFFRFFRFWGFYVAVFLFFTFHTKNKIFLVFAVFGECRLNAQRCGYSDKPGPFYCAYIIKFSILLLQVGSFGL